VTTTIPDLKANAAGAVLAIWTDIAPELEADFNEWYWREHLPERLAVPGFRCGRRYRAGAGAPRYFACYELDSLDILDTPAYLERLDNPTDWTRRVMPGFRNTTRALVRVVTTLGRMSGAVALTVRVAPAEDRRADLEAHLRRTILPALHARPGIVRLQHWQAEPMTARSTIEAALRGGSDGTCDWVVIVEGTRPEDLKAIRDELVAATSPLVAGMTRPPIDATYNLLCSLEAGP